MRPGPTSIAPPRQYVVPTIHGDPAAAHRLADAYRELADAISAAQLRCGHIVNDLSRAWRGVGHRGIDAPVEAFLQGAGRLIRMLREAATELDVYGRHLEKAKHHHGFSLHKLLVVGAIVTVSVAAVVVTVGAAGVVEAAAATAAVGGTIEAAGAATAADLSAAAGVDVALDGASSLRPLLAFVVPHLVQVEWAAGGTAAWNELTLGRLDWGQITANGAVAFVGAGSATAATKLAADTAWASPQLIEGTAWAAAAAGDDELVNHRISLLDVSESFVVAGGGTLGRDALREHDLWPAETDYRREALINLRHQKGLIADRGIAHELSVLRQSAREIQRGDFDLTLHEGPGHTIGRHVGRTASELRARVRANRRISTASTYWDDNTANDSIRLAIAASQPAIARWLAAGSVAPLRLHITAPFDVGFAVNASGRVWFVRKALVVLRSDKTGIWVLTSYPVGRG
jgi:uncharacterized protein YukE